jgi:two-component system LytT family sensor kinase
MEPLPLDPPTPDQAGAAASDLVPRARLPDLIGLGPLFLLAFGFWTVTAVVFALHDAAVGALAARPGGSRSLFQLLVMELASWWPCALLTPPVVATTLRAREPGASLGRALAVHAGGAAIFVIVAGSLMGMAESLVPWARHQGGLAQVVGWGVLRYVGVNLLLYALMVAGAEAAAHAWESRQRALAAAVYARQLAEARLHVLSAQLQPHFLFNALHAISALVWEDQARADRLLARLSDLLRLTLRSGNRVETTLAEEVILLQHYAEIQEARYGDRLRVSFDVESRVREALVPRLILQPLVENAIRHGVTRRISPGQVEVRAWERGGRLHLTVRDDGVGLGAQVREGLGLSITRARLRQLYGREQRFALAAAPAGGAVCTLSFPLRLAPAGSS